MSVKSWELGFHLRSPRCWLNDPNGLCQFGSIYHFFYQYNHAWPHMDQKAWGHFASPDLVHWRYEGVSIEPSIAEDRHGVWSGCALVEHGCGADTGEGATDRLHAYYTGNVICPGPNHDPRDVGFVNEGREASQILCSSVDGIHFGKKTVVLGANDYPDFCSCHVRDPKVWEQDGRLYMLLGARDVVDHGLCLLYGSADGLHWTYEHAIRPAYPFGYMWECPNIVQVADREFLVFSPQGLPRAYDRWHNLCQAGYVPLRGRVIDTYEVDERTFVEWDHGHDFYAPQTFVDDAGRSILVGWLGSFDHRFRCAPEGLDWVHCLTVPRVITMDETCGLLRQNPVPELEVLRGACVTFKHSVPTTMAGRHADVVIQGIDREGALTLDDDFQVFFEQGRLGIRYANDHAAAGRRERSIPLRTLTDLRVLVDGSVVEVYANGGAEVFSSRWFCADTNDLTLTHTFSEAEATAWEMEDVLSDLYATAQAPDLALPGWNA